MTTGWRAFTVLLMDKIIKWGVLWGGCVLVLHIMAGFSS